MRSPFTVIRWVTIAFVSVVLPVGLPAPGHAQTTDEHRKNVEAYLAEENHLTRASMQRLQDLFLESALNRLDSFATLRRGPEPCELQEAEAFRKPNYLWSLTLPAIADRVNAAQLARYWSVTKAVRAHAKQRRLTGPVLEAFIDVRLAQIYVNELTAESRRLAFVKDEQSLKDAVEAGLMSALDQMPHCKCQQ